MIKQLSLLEKLNAIKDAVIEKDFKPGKVECHGHGDFWATDRFIFTYYRLPEEE